MNEDYLMHVLNEIENEYDDYYNATKCLVYNQ